MNPVVNICTASSQNELEQILKLQSENHFFNFSNENKPPDGFLTVKHDLQLLMQMNKATRQVIVKDSETVVGYALALLTSSINLLPQLFPICNTFNNLYYKGKQMSQVNYYVMSQICIAKGYRGNGIFSKLYQKHKELYGKNFDCAVTEVSARNLHSMRAHEKTGFKIVHTYQDETDEWNILLWDWH